MRAALFVFLVTLAGCATDTIGEDGAVQSSSVSMRILTTGSYAAATPEKPAAVLVRSAEEFPRVWSETVGGGELPRVDFAAESVVILLAGQKSSGGWSVEPRGVRAEGGVLVVDAAIKSPPPDAVVTMALTSPFAVIAVGSKSVDRDASRFDGVRWNP